MAVFWGWIFEGIAPDTYDVIGTLVTVAGVIIIYYVPRKGEEKSLWQSKL
jgi:small multidrug resistance family-3 protein